MKKFLIALLILVSMVALANTCAHGWNLIFEMFHAKGIWWNSLHLLVAFGSGWAIGREIIAPSILWLMKKEKETCSQ